MSGSVRKMQKMLDICNEYGKKYGINFNALKTKWFCTDVHGNSRLVYFTMNDIILENAGKIIKFLGVGLVIKRGLLTMDINDRIMKFNAACYNVLLNSNDLSEVIRCELIVKKCVPVLMYGIGCVRIDAEEEYKMHIAYRKIFRYIFHISLRSHISELLEVFRINTIHNLIKNKITRCIMQNIETNFHKVRFVTLYAIRSGIYNVY